MIVLLSMIFGMVSMWSIMFFWMTRQEEPDSFGWIVPSLLTEVPVIVLWVEFVKAVR